MDMIRPILQTLNLWHVSLLSDLSPLNLDLATYFRSMVSTPSFWKLTMVKDMQFPAGTPQSAIALNASQLASQIAAADVRVIVLLLESPDAASVLLCACQAVGHFITWVNPLAWVPDFSSSGISRLNQALGQGGLPFCSQDQLLKGSFGMLLMDRGPMRDSPESHGLSGRRLQDIRRGYLAECGAFANGAGQCHDYAGYYYDAAWEWVWLQSPQDRRESLVKADSR